MKKTINECKKNINMICRLTINDIKSRYSGSLLGFLWAYIQPMFMILVFWYVFQIGFKNPPVSSVEFILWFISGYIPWIFFNDAIVSSCNVIYEYSYLVKKMKFKIWMLPVIKICSSFLIHSMFVIFVFVMFLIYGYTFNYAWLSIIYYSLGIVVLSIGLAFLLSTLAVFIKDFVHFIGIILQLWFWITPIFWSDEMMSDKTLKVLSKNPMYYIVSGYREAMINNNSFLMYKNNIVLFWGVTLVTLIIGIYTHRKMKSHFADLI